jgi:hypothetical protein
MGGIGPTTGIVAQQIPGISNRIGKTADPAAHFSNSPAISRLGVTGDVILVKPFAALSAATYLCDTVF